MNMAYHCTVDIRVHIYVWHGIAFGWRIPTRVRCMCLFFSGTLSTIQRCLSRWQWEPLILYFRLCNLAMCFVSARVTFISNVIESSMERGKDGVRKIEQKKARPAKDNTTSAPVPAAAAAAAASHRNFYWIHTCDSPFQHFDNDNTEKHPAQNPDRAIAARRHTSQPSTETPLAVISGTRRIMCAASINLMLNGWTEMITFSLLPECRTAIHTISMYVFTLCMCVVVYAELIGSLHDDDTNSDRAPNTCDCMTVIMLIKMKWTFCVCKSIKPVLLCVCLVHAFLGNNKKKI